MLKNVQQTNKLVR